MANVDVAAQRLVRGNGVTPATVNLTNADTYFVSNSGSTFLRFVGDATNARNISIASVGSVDGNAIASRVIALPANAERVWGIAPVEFYGSKVQITVDGSGVKLQAFTL